MRSMFIRPAALAAVYVLALSAPAHAYLDPGTASIVIQSIIGAVAAGMG